jgi:hypothetical protein
MRSGTIAAALAAAAALLAAAPAAAQGQGDGRCVGELDASRVPLVEGAPPLRFGVTPGVETGQLGTGPATVVPESPRRHLAALARLRPPRREPFVLRLHRFFWSDGERAIRRFLALTRRYTRRGYLVELQLRYHPAPEQEGDIGAWKRHVREVVRRFGRYRSVVAIQVTNEVNLTWSPDSSDGAYDRAREALVEGVIAAKREARRRRLDRLEIGFNWAYRMDPESERSFWTAIRDAPPEFRASLDWVGLDAYPGTFFPPVVTPSGGERGAMVNAMSTIRCFLAYAGIPASVPLKVEENGWPTSPPARSYEQQAQRADALVRAVHDYRGTFNVTDYRWFNLRDGDSSSPNFQVQYGLVRSDYVAKPAFEVYRRLVAEL